uniref:Uncharacterized protein n=1 Tax=Timema poppense TaxID=170557 RepID=A0A7R9HCD4_TIMPO|nr:unnamed protein product [Timema poppensis]
MLTIISSVNRGCCSSAVPIHKPPLAMHERLLHDKLQFPPSLSSSAALYHSRRDGCDAWRRDACTIDSNQVWTPTHITLPVGHKSSRRICVGICVEGQGENTLNTPAPDLNPDLYVTEKLDNMRLTPFSVYPTGGRSILMYPAPSDDVFLVPCYSVPQCAARTRDAVSRGGPSPMASLVLTDSSQLTAFKSYHTKLYIPTPNHMI